MEKWAQDFGVFPGPYVSGVFLRLCVDLDARRELQTRSIE